MDLETLKIDLGAVKDGTSSYTFRLDNDYFAGIEGSEVSGGNVCVNIEVTRVNDTSFLVDIQGKGTVVVPCDVCLDPLDQAIEVNEHLDVKLGKENSEEDNLVTVAEDEGILDVSWLLYEFIALEIPTKHVHAPGKCNSAMVRALQEYSAARSGEEDEKPIDPRWEALLKLKE